MSDRDLPKLPRTPLVLNWFGMGVHNVRVADGNTVQVVQYGRPEGMEDS